MNGIHDAATDPAYDALHESYDVATVSAYDATHCQVPDRSKSETMTFTRKQLTELLKLYSTQQKQSVEFREKSLENIKSEKEMKQATLNFRMYTEQEKKSLGAKEAIAGLFYIHDGKFPEEV